MPCLLTEKRSQFKACLLDVDSISEVGTSIDGLRSKFFLDSEDLVEFGQTFGSSLKIN